MTHLEVEHLGEGVVKVTFRDRLGVDWGMVHGSMECVGKSDRKAGMFVECATMKKGGRAFVRVAWVGGGA